MKRRKTVQMLGTAGVAATVSGCGSMLGGSCGPGEDEIGAVATRVGSAESGTAEGSTATSEDPSVSVVGEIQSIGENEVIIDDGTGVAKLTTLTGGFRIQNVGEGDCASATGVAVPPEEERGNDVQIFIEEIGLADE